MAPAARRGDMSRFAIGRWLLTIMVILSLGVVSVPHAHHSDSAQPLSAAVMAEGGAADVEREGTLLHSLFGHNGAGHTSTHGVALPVSLDMTFATLASKHAWTVSEDQRLTSHDASALMRPPRA